MFVRRKQNSSGSTSIQVIDKSKGKYTVVTTIGSSKNPSELDSLELQGRQFILSYLQQEQINFSFHEDEHYLNTIFKEVETLQLAGPELILGKIFDDIGFNQIPDKLFRHLVISRVCFPLSKLKTVDYLYRYKGLIINVQRIYRYMDKFKPQAERNGAANQL